MAVLIVDVCWIISGTLVEIFLCWPIESYWNPVKRDGARCIDAVSFWDIMPAVELVIDVIVFVLPLYQISQLKLSGQKQVLIMIVFFLGGL